MSNSNLTKHPVRDDINLDSQDELSQPQQDLQAYEADEIVEHQPPPRRQRRWPWILGILLLLGVWVWVGGGGNRAVHRLMLPQVAHQEPPPDNRQECPSN
jgi:hypothetical protein